MPTIGQKLFTIFKVMMIRDTGCQQPSGSYGVSILRGNDAHLSLLDNNRVRNGYVKEIWIDAVFAGGKNINLRAFLSAILQEGLSILK